MRQDIAEIRAIYPVKRIRSIFSEPETRANFDSVFQLFRGKTVLDVGCNAGYFSVWISRYARFVHGIDINADCIGAAEQLRSKLRHSPKNVQFDTQSAISLSSDDIRDKSISAIWEFKSAGYWSQEDYIRFWESCVRAGVDMFITRKVRDCVHPILQANNYKIECQHSIFFVVTRGS